VPKIDFISDGMLAQYLHLGVFALRSWHDHFSRGLQRDSSAINMLIAILLMAGALGIEHGLPSKKPEVSSFATT
jgi:hypothetical protein